jgi:hypothetical protein
MNRYLTNNKEAIKIVFLIFFAFYTVFQISAQQSNTKVSVVFGGYRTIGVNNKTIDFYL